MKKNQFLSVIFFAVTKLFEDEYVCIFLMSKFNFSAFETLLSSVKKDFYQRSVNYFAFECLFCRNLFVPDVLGIQ